MRSRFPLAVLLICLARTAFASTCGGFSIVPADHVIVQYSAPLPAGATLAPPTVTVLGTDIQVSRNVSSGSSVDVACVDDRVDLGYLGAGRFNLTWSDNAGLTTQRSTFAFLVGTPAAGIADETSALLPLLPDQPVRLEVNACSQRPAVAYRSGNDIEISQYGTGSACKLYLLDFGVLPEGIYNVKTTRLDGASAAPALTSFSFIVQQPPPVAIFYLDSDAITPTDHGTAHLHHGVKYVGATPRFDGFPGVTEIATYVDPETKAAWPLTTIIRPVTDSVDTTRITLGSWTSFVRAQDLDIGAPANGYNEIRWYDQVSVNGTVVGFQSANPPVGFQWTNGTVQCSSFPRITIPSPVFEGVPFDVTLTTMGTLAAGPTVTKNGPNFFIYLQPDQGEVLPAGPPQCTTYSARVTSSFAGLNSLAWFYASNGKWVELAASNFTVLEAPRRRAARH